MERKDQVQKDRAFPLRRLESRKKATGKMIGVAGGTIATEKSRLAYTQQRRKGPHKKRHAARIILSARVRYGGINRSARFRDETRGGNTADEACPLAIERKGSCRGSKEKGENVTCFFPASRLGTRSGLGDSVRETEGYGTKDTEGRVRNRIVPPSKGRSCRLGAGGAATSIRS